MSSKARIEVWEGIDDWSKRYHRSLVYRMFYQCLRNSSLRAGTPELFCLLRTFPTIRLYVVLAGMALLSFTLAACSLLLLADNIYLLLASTIVAYSLCMMAVAYCMLLAFISTIAPRVKVRYYVPHVVQPL